MGYHTPSASVIVTSTVGPAVLSSAVIAFLTDCFSSEDPARFSSFILGSVTALYN